MYTQKHCTEIRQTKIQLQLILTDAKPIPFKEKKNKQNKNNTLHILMSKWENINMLLITLLYKIKILKYI